LFKTGLSTTLFKEFSSTYQSISGKPETQVPFIYADRNGIKLVTSVLDLISADSSELCALTMAEDGWMEIVSLND
jgi:hypothetical protein